MPKRSVSSLNRVRKQQPSRFRRALKTELLERRELMAGDLANNELVIGSIPKEPADLVAADREHYANYNSEPTPSSGTGSKEDYILSLADTFFLHSRPTATKTIYLDFDGFSARGTPWNQSRGRDPIVSPAWDVDGDGAAFSNAELRRIQGVWQRVATDFAAFDVNVTTEDPGEAALVNTGGSDDRWGIRVVFTPDDFPTPGSGGVAYINSFNWGYNTPGATDTPCYVFNMSEVAAAGAASHEVGHALGLSHDGTTDQHPTQPSQGYYNGHGSGENGWGPIMGVGGYYQNVTTWDNAIYFASNNGAADANYGSGPDDLQVITTQNGFTYVPDPEANILTSATFLSQTIDYANAIANVSQLGVISTTNDIDVFRFQTGAGTVNLTFDPYVTQTFVRTSATSFAQTNEASFYGNNWSQNQGTNLDIQATLYDSTGAVVAVSDPTGLRASFTNLQLAAGTYYVALDGVGFGTPRVNPPTGYTDYASLGQYLVTGTLPVALGLILPNGSVTYTEGTAPVQVTSSATVFDGVPGDYSTSQLEVSISPAPGATDRIRFDPTLTGLTENAGAVLDGAQTIATRSLSSNTQLRWNFTANATALSIEKMVQSITFEAQGDAPDTTPRSVRFQLTKGALSGFSDVAVTVVPLNDAPSLQAATLKPVAEDSKNPEGQTVAEVFGGLFSDPDPGASLRGIAISQNNTPASEGVWQIAFAQNGPWQSLPAVSDNTRLALGLNARLRFLPGTDFFGTVTPLQVLAIDETYSGAFSAGNGLVNLPPALRGPDSPVAMVASDLSLEVTPVNDAPRPQVPELRYSVTQDQPLFGVIPASAVIDIDDTSLEYSATQSDGSPLPAWLRVNSSAAQFEGTPGSFDVRTLSLTLTVKDPGGLKATIPVIIDVINVNDPPTQLRFTGGTVKENTSGNRIGLINGFDPDGDAIFWTSSDARFVVRDGEVFLNSPLDFETASDRQILVTFRAIDVGSPPLSTDLDVIIKTEDVNEFIPRLVSESYTIIDGTASGTVIDLLQAVDGDTQQTVRYRLHSGDTSAFTVDSQSGVLKLATTADIDLKSQYKVFVEAYDNGSPSYSTTAQYIINVLPANFFAPEFDTVQQLVFPENINTATLVGKVKVTDLDGNPLKYTLLDVAGGFIDWISVDSATGNVFATPASRFDFESNTDYSIEVQVEETIPGGHVITGVVPIQLTNVNDRPSGLAALSIYPQRLGAVVTSNFDVQDQDPSVTGYTFSTTDPRFEIRNGRLALKPDQILLVSQVGQTLSVPIRVVDQFDTSSFANINADVVIVSANAWQNPLNPLDVTRDGQITASDALQIINRLNNANVSRSLSTPRPFDQLNAPDIDTSGDNFLSASDALRVINLLNSQSGSGGEGEQSREKEASLAGSVDEAGSDLWYLAYSQLEEETTTRRRR